MERKLEILGDLLDGAEEDFDISKVENFEQNALGSSEDSFFEALMQQLISYEERIKEKKARYERRKERQQKKQEETTQNENEMISDPNEALTQEFMLPAAVKTFPNTKVLASSPFFGSQENSVLGKRKFEPDGIPEKNSRRIIVDMDDDFVNENLLEGKVESSGLSKLDQFQFQ